MAEGNQSIPSGLSYRLEERSWPLTLLCIECIHLWWQMYEPDTQPEREGGWVVWEEGGISLILNTTPKEYFLPASTLLTVCGSPSTEVPTVSPLVLSVGKWTNPGDQVSGRRNPVIPKSLPHGGGMLGGEQIVHD